MDAVELIARARADGLDVAPALGAHEIPRLEPELGAPLPGELRAVVEQTAAIGGTRLGEIDFSGRTMDYEDRDLFPSGLPIAGDGSGNFWLLDLTPTETETAIVFFACHDPPVVLYEYVDLGGFLDDVFASDAAQLDDVRQRAREVWRTNPGSIEHADALTGDDELRSFASGLDERFTFVDLRSPSVGMGVAWGRYGPRTEVRRYGYERLFACAPPERRPGLVSRLFGRRPRSR